MHIVTKYMAVLRSEYVFNRKKICPGCFSHSYRQKEKQVRREYGNYEVLAKYHCYVCGYSKLYIGMGKDTKSAMVECAKQVDEHIDRRLK